MEWYIQKVRRNIGVGDTDILLTDHCREVPYRRIPPLALLGLRISQLIAKASGPISRCMLTTKTMPLVSYQAVSFLANSLPCTPPIDS